MHRLLVRSTAVSIAPSPNFRAFYGPSHYARRTSSSDACIVLLRGVNLPSVLIVLDFCSYRCWPRWASLPDPTGQSCQSRWAFLLTFAGVGLRHQTSELEAGPPAHSQQEPSGKFIDRRPWVWFMKRTTTCICKPEIQFVPDTPSPGPTSAPLRQRSSEQSKHEFPVDSELPVGGGGETGWTETAWTGLRTALPLGSRSIPILRVV